MEIALPEGRIVCAAIKTPYTIHVWNLQTGEKLCTFKGHEKEINGIAISVKGDIIVSASTDKTLRIWDYQDPQKCKICVHDRAVAACAISRDGSFAVSAGTTLQMWDTSSGACLKTFHKVPFPKPGLTGCAISHDDNNILLSYVSGYKLFEKSTEKIVSEVKCSYALESCKLTKSGLLLTTSPSPPVNVRLWNTNHEDCIQTFSHAKLPSDPYKATDCDLSQSEEFIVSSVGQNAAHPKHFIHFWHKNDPNVVESVHVPHASVVCKITNDDKFVVSASTKIAIIDVISKNIVKTFDTAATLGCMVLWHPSSNNDVNIAPSKVQPVSPPSTSSSKVVPSNLPKPDNLFVPNIKRAIVIISSDYDKSTSWPALKHARKDGQTMRNFLEERGFEVEYFLNKEKEKIETEIQKAINLADNLADLDRKALYVIYYSGHGTFSDGHTFAHTITGEEINLDLNIKKLAARANTYVIGFFDCCRQIIQKKGTPSNTEEVPSKGQLYVVYGAPPGNAALAVQGDELSKATKSFMEHLAVKKDVVFPHSLLDWSAKSDGIEIVDHAHFVVNID